MAEAERCSLFDRATLEGVRAALDEAVGAERGGSAGARAQRERCEEVIRGVEASDAGRAEEAQRLIDAGLEGATDLRLLFLGFQFHFRSGRYDQAERLARHRLELAGEETAEAARAWSNLGLVYFFRKDLTTAEGMFRRAVEIDRAIGHAYGLARDLGNLALVPEARGELDAAERLYREGLEIAERIGAVKIAASKLSNLGEVAKGRGRRDEARTLWVRAERIFAEAGEEKHRKQCEEWIKALDPPHP